MDRFPKYFFQSQKVILFIIILFTQNLSVFANQTAFDTTKITYVDIKEGDLCIVCDMKINSNTGIGILFDGRRVTLDLEHLKEFINKPDTYFHKLQANVALYDEGVFNNYQMNYGWFIFGLWILSALISSAFCVSIALKKGLDIKKWFFIGLMTNIFGLIYLILSAKKQSVILPEKLGKIALTEKPIKCRGCEEYNHPSAKKCTTCGKDLISMNNSEVGKI